MKIGKAAVIIFCAILITFGIVALVYTFMNVQHTRNYDMDIIVSESGVGMNADTDAIHFGRLTRGGSSIRKLDLNNTFDTEKMVVMQFSGELAAWVSVAEKEFVMQPGEFKVVNITANVPPNAEIRKYTGKAQIFFKKVG